MKWFAVALLLLVIIGLSGAAYIRVAPEDPARWHVDPADVTLPSTPNYAILRDGDAPTFAVRPPQLAEAVVQVIEAEERMQRLAGSPETGLLTYVQRSEMLAFPDYITAKIETNRGGSRLLLFSRSRYGHSDLGVNAARVERIVEGVRAALGE